MSEPLATTVITPLSENVREMYVTLLCVCVCVRACVCVLVGSIQTERQQHVCSRLQSQQVSKHVNSMLNLGDYQSNVLMF